jgi:hypothetical protein
MTEDDDHHYPNFSGPLLDRDTLMSVLAKVRNYDDRHYGLQVRFEGDLHVSFGESEDAPKRVQSLRERHRRI